MAQKSKVYRYRLPGQPQWKEVVCYNLTEAKYIIRMEHNCYGEGKSLPRGTIVERKPRGEKESTP